MYSFCGNPGNFDAGDRLVPGVKIQYRKTRESCQPVSEPIVASLLNALIPRRCLLCRCLSDNSRICRACTDDMPWTESRCDWCGCELPGGYHKQLCGSCEPADGRSVQIFSALSYEYPVDQLVIGAKFRCLPIHACALGELLGRSLDRREQAGLLIRPDIVVPVPLHRTRLAWRGFNQTAEISRVLAGELGLPVDEQCCRRSRATREQSGLSGPERRRNVRDAFDASASVAGKQIAIVDDVFTTGCTVLALADALRDSGAGHVQVWTVARSVQPGLVVTAGLSGR